MEDLFVFLLDRSVSAGWLILAVIAVRLIFRRMPASWRCALWGIVGLRLVLPFSIPSILSLLPSATTVPADIAVQQAPTIQSGIPLVDVNANAFLTEHFTPLPAESMNPLQLVQFLLAWVWVIGVGAMLLYMLISRLALSRRVREAVPLRDGMFLCDRAKVPFILGLFRPRIYLPVALDEGQIDRVEAHERAHLRRGDHWWKFLGFLILSVYWFAPLAWVAYLLLGRDIERACDEAVIRPLDGEARAAYSETLLACSTGRNARVFCPLAFSEIGVKARIRAILNYKKPAFRIVIVALIATAALIVCLCTVPMKPAGDDPITLPGCTAAVTNVPEVQITVLSIDEDSVTVRWDNAGEGELSFGEPFILFADGEEVSLKPDHGWTLPLYTVMPGGWREQTYHIGSFDVPKQFTSLAIRQSFTYNGKEGTAEILLTDRGDEWFTSGSPYDVDVALFSDGSARIIFPPTSSFAIPGGLTWSEKDGTVTITSEYGDRYVFRRDGEGLRFDGKDSSKIFYFKDGDALVPLTAEHLSGHWATQYTFGSVPDPGYCVLKLYWNGLATVDFPYTESRPIEGLCSWNEENGFTKVCTPGGGLLLFRNAEEGLYYNAKASVGGSSLADNSLFINSSPDYYQ